MSYRKIAAFPFVWVSLFLAVLLFIPAEARRPLYLLEGESSKALAVLGCFVAAYTFERGDYMRRAWSFNGWCYLLLLTRDLTLNLVAPGTPIPGPGNMTIAVVEGNLALAANVSSVWGTWLLARAWSIAGLEFPGSRAGKLALTAAAAAFAIAVSGTDLVMDCRVLFGGDLGVLHSVASDLGDTFGLCLLAPMILTALAMTGGVLRWPWGLLTACLVFWLFSDAMATLDHFVPGHEVTTRLARETFRALACACECAAGLAQRRVVTAPPEEEPA